MDSIVDHRFRIQQKLGKGFRENSQEVTYRLF